MRGRLSPTRNALAAAQGKFFLSAATIFSRAIESQNGGLFIATKGCEGERGGTSQEINVRENEVVCMYVCAYG